jgi:hypothetical protein
VAVKFKGKKEEKSNLQTIKEIISKNILVK